MNEGLHWIDFLIIAAYCCAVLAMGWVYSRRQLDRDEYFTGGRRMNPILIGISLFATMLSTISYLAKPGEIIRHGPYILWSLLAIPFAYLVVGYVLIPIFMRYRLTSAYELLEMKLGPSSRLLGAGMFVLLRLMWMSVLLNFASGAFLIMTGLGDEWLLPVTAIIGLITLVYSSLGGLRAVVVTDTVQFVLLLGGALLVVVVITLQAGGLGWFPRSWDPSWQVQPIWSLDPHIRLTVVGVILSQILWTLATAGGDQTVIQRFMATKNASDARRSYLVNSAASVIVFGVLTLVGLALMAYFRMNPGQLPGETIQASADGLFPWFIAHALPVGLSGLVVTGMFAAAMSSVDSGVNSITAVVTVDFLDRFRSRAKSPASSAGERDRMDVSQGRWITVGVGLLVIALSTLIEYVPGNLLDVSKRATDLLVTPIFTLFLMALFVRFATPAGANTGATCGFLGGATIAFWNPLFDQERALSFTWISPVALVVGVTVGCVVSLLTARSLKSPARLARETTRGEPQGTSATSNR
jgi:SSS family solute:Na+ symporter